MGVRNSKMGRGQITAPLHAVAFTEPVVEKRGKAASGSRVSRVGSTARKTGSGVAGMGRS